MSHLQKEELPEHAADPVKWEIERTDRYYYHPSRNGIKWVETTYWYNPYTLERKETTRSFDSYDEHDYLKPEWAKGITEFRRILNPQ